MVEPPGLVWGFRKNNGYITFFLPPTFMRRGRWKALRYRCEIDRNQLSFETKKNAIEAIPSGKTVDRNDTFWEGWAQRKTGGK